MLSKALSTLYLAAYVQGSDKIDWGEPIYLQNEATGKYYSQAVSTSGGYSTPTQSANPAQLEFFPTKDIDYMKNGQVIRLIDYKTPIKETNVAYCSSAGSIYYDQARDGDKQQSWKVEKQVSTDLRTSSSGYVKHGDLIRLRNEYYPTVWMNAAENLKYIECYSGADMDYTTWKILKKNPDVAKKLEIKGKQVLEWRQMVTGANISQAFSKGFSTTTHEGTSTTTSNGISVSASVSFAGPGVGGTVSATSSRNKSLTREMSQSLQKSTNQQCTSSCSNGHHQMSIWQQVAVDQSSGTEFFRCSFACTSPVQKPKCAFAEDCCMQDCQVCRDRRGSCPGEQLLQELLDFETEFMI